MTEFLCSRGRPITDEDLAIVDEFRQFLRDRATTTEKEHDMSNRQKATNTIPLGNDPHRRPANIEAWCRQQQIDRTPHHGINAYTCDDCGLNTVTIDVDPGVTSMFITCRRTPGCSGQAASSGYPDAEPPPTITLHLDWEWVTPTEAEFKKLSPNMQSHVDQGGLVLRPRTDRASAYRVIA